MRALVMLCAAGAGALQYEAWLDSLQVFDASTVLQQV